MGRADMHITSTWARAERNAAIRSMEWVPEPDSTKAQATAYIATANHPKDHHVFTALAIVPGVHGGNIPSDVRQQLQLTLNEYLADHPNGLDNSVVSV